jgi:hypothetical protein
MVNKTMSVLAINILFRVLTIVFFCFNVVFISNKKTLEGMNFKRFVF